MLDIVHEDIQTIVRGIQKDSKKFAGKTVLVTGGAGFLGTFFVGVFDALNKKILSKPCKVIVLDNFITGREKNVLGLTFGKHISLVQHDVRTPFIPKGSVDYIIHAAGIASPVFYMAHPLETIEAATKGLQNMLELARKKKPTSMLSFSSSEVYGDPHPDYIPTPETYRGHVSSIGPRACYDESKRLGETLCMTYHKLYKVPINIVRPFNVYGPGMRPDDYRVLPQFITCAMRGDPLPIHGNGMQTRTYCYITDAMTGFFKVLLSKHTSEVFNIGNERPEINLVDLSHLVISLMGDNVTAKKIPYPSVYPADEPNRRCPDISKSRTHLGYQPTVNLKSGIARLMAWYRATYDVSKNNLSRVQLT
ncbi:MAG: NAD-dependent epimerase/dehydratase family protein [Patescibacteria group bacterium]